MHPPEVSFAIAKYRETLQQGEYETVQKRDGISTLTGGHCCRHKGHGLLLPCPYQCIEGNIGGSR